MMTEFWVKVFIFGGVTTAVTKFFGCGMNVFLLFSLSSVGWAVGFILLMVIFKVK